MTALSDELHNRCRVGSVELEKLRGQLHVATKRAEKAEEAHATLVGKIGQIIESLRS